MLRARADLLARRAEIGRRKLHAANVSLSSGAGWRGVRHVVVKKQFFTNSNSAFSFAKVDKMKFCSLASASSVRRTGASTVRSFSNKRSANKRSCSSTCASDSGFFSSFSSPIAWYSAKLDSAPILTKGVTAALVGSCGDFNCQLLMHSNKGGTLHDFVWDRFRTGRFGLLGAALVAPVSHFWYGFLSSRIPGSTLAATAKRVFMDQAAFAPIFISTYVTSLKALEGETIADSAALVKESFVDMYQSNLLIWVPAMSLNFYLVPLKFQVLFANCVGLIWNTYLSWKSQEDMKGKGGGEMEGREL